MRRKTIWILGVALLSLVFQGESCLLEQRTVSAIIGSSVPAEWHTQGFTQTSDRDTVDVAAEIRNAIEDIDLENISHIGISGGCYEVDENTGHLAARVGDVSVDGHHFLHFNVPTNATGTSGSTGDGTLTLDSNGVTYFDGLVNNYLNALKAGHDLPLTVIYDASWTSTPPPTEGDPDNFNWHVCVNLQVQYQVDVDVPTF